MPSWKVPAVGRREGLPGNRAHARLDYLQTAFRIQGTGFPPISAPLRASGSSRMSWNRFDIPGDTVYFADKALCAYQEVLAQFKRKLGVADPLAKDAEALGLKSRRIL